MDDVKDPRQHCIMASNRGTGEKVSFHYPTRVLGMGRANPPGRSAQSRHIPPNYSTVPRPGSNYTKPTFSFPFKNPLFLLGEAERVDPSSELRGSGRFSKADLLRTCNALVLLHYPPPPPPHPHPSFFPSLVCQAGSLWSIRFDPTCLGR